MSNNNERKGVLEIMSDSESTYQVEGRKYIVTSVFKEDSPETLWNILMKLIQEDARQKR